MIAHGMTSLTKTLAAVLVVSSITIVHGQNACFADVWRCFSGNIRPDLSDCSFTDADIPDVNDCLDLMGRSDILVINFDSNAFTTIPSSILEGMASVTSFSASRNAITTIEEGALQQVASTLGILRLEHNQLGTIPSYLFAGMGAIIRLNLIDNQLTSLPADAFVGLTNMNSLELSDNPGLQCIPDTTALVQASTTDEFCECNSVATCGEGTCTPGSLGYTCSACAPGVDVCDDPHMQGLRGQKIDWSGVDGGWYCLVTDDDANLRVNVRLTAPLPEAFPDRQLITGLSVVSEGHSLTIEVANPYNVDTDGCARDLSPCLANGGLRAIVDGEEVDGLLRPSRNEYVVDGIAVSASNLPVECRHFGGDTIWARMYDEMLQGTRQLNVDESFEDWILSFDHMAAVDWCTQYIAQHSLAHVQSKHAIFKIVTSSVTVRLNVGTNFQGNGELDWDGRVLPDLEFWQMDVGLHGLSIEGPSLSGILGETARPVLDKNGHEVMEGYDAFRGTAGDYRVSGALGTDFAMLNKT